MKRNERAQQRERTRQKILAAAARLFSERGYDGVSMDDMARAIKMTKGALYGHFANKDDLYVQSVNAHLQHALSKVDLRAGTEDAESQLMQYLKQMLELVASDRILRRLVIRLLTDADSRLARRVVGTTLNRYFEHCVGLVQAWRPGLDARAYVYSFFCTAILGHDLQKFVEVLSPELRGAQVGAALLTHFREVLA